MTDRFVIIILEEHNEIQLVDTEEENVLLFGCNYEDEDLFFIKQDLEQVTRELNRQDRYIKELIKENRELKFGI